MIFPAEHGHYIIEEDTVFASNNPEDLTLLPTPPFKPLGSHVVFLTYVEHVALNPPDGPVYSTPATDTQLFRDDPRTVSQVLANWAEFEVPERTRLERNCEDFKAQLHDYLRVYDKLRKEGNQAGVAQLENDLIIMIDSAQASGQADTDPELRQTIENVRYALAA